MNKRKLSQKFDWQRWSSTEEDRSAMDPALAGRILFQIYLINAFENELLRLQNSGCVWGPVHSSVGQEAVAAAAMAGLRNGDRITGSHRAHHQFLSKSLNYALPDDWNPVETPLAEKGHEVVRRTLAEIMGLKPGYCGGRGGSMHLRYPDAGVIGTNAIVGGGIPLAAGAAFAEKRRGSKNIVVCFFGDGAANQGSFHEAANLAGLWHLPIIFFIENNEYAVGTRLDDASAVNDLSLRSVGYGMTARIVEGYDVAAVYGAVYETAERIRRGAGPCIIEAKCYRHYHHKGDQPGSAYGYRDKEEEAEYRRKDALLTFPRLLEEMGVFSAGETENVRHSAVDAVEKAVEFCTEGQDNSRVNPALWPDPETAGTGLRSDGRELAGIRYSRIEEFSEFEQVRYSDAVAAVTGRWMEKDPEVLELGEEVANFGGGAYGATMGLAKQFPNQVINTPISEAGFVGLACGAAMCGLKPIVEIMFPDFSLVAADQLFNQIAKARHMYGNTTDLPLIVRTRVATGQGFGGQHSMDPVGLFALFSGWRIVSPSCAFDYIGLFNTAMHSLDPVVFLEHHSLYSMKFPVPRDIDYCISFGEARILSAGSDVTVLSYGGMTVRMEALLEELKGRETEVELIDLRTLDLPCIDFDTIGSSVKKTGALIIVEEAARGQSIGPRIAAEINERFFDELDAPPRCLASLDVPTPVSRVLETAAIISDREITEKVQAMARREWP